MSSFCFSLLVNFSISNITHAGISPDPARSLSRHQELIKKTKRKESKEKRSKLIEFVYASGKKKTRNFTISRGQRVRREIRLKNLRQATHNGWCDELSSRIYLKKITKISILAPSRSVKSVKKNCVLFFSSHFIFNHPCIPNETSDELVKSCQLCATIVVQSAP